MNHEKSKSHSHVEMGCEIETLLPQGEKLDTQRKTRKMRIALPKETTDSEHRIALTPQAVEMLVEQGHELLVERGAGAGASFSDELYSQAGAAISDSKTELYQAEVVIKVAPFTTYEIELLRGRQTILSAFNISSQKPDQIKSLMRKKVTAIGFEFVMHGENHPIVQAMSEIAGFASIMIASEYLSNYHGGKGILLGGVTGIMPADVVILGSGTASEYAARTAMGLGAAVKIFDTSLPGLRQLQLNLEQRIHTCLLNERTLVSALRQADVVIGALDPIDGPGFKVPSEMVAQMKAGSVIIDLSIDRGGCFETSRLTTHKDPVFTHGGVVHYCVPNIASRVARTASMALSDICSQLLGDLAVGASANVALKENSGLSHGLYLFNGILTQEHIGRAFGIKSQSFDLLRAGIGF